MRSSAVFSCTSSRCTRSRWARSAQPRCQRGWCHRSMRAVSLPRQLPSHRRRVLELGDAARAHEQQSNCRRRATAAASPRSFLTADELQTIWAATAGVDDYDASSAYCCFRACAHRKSATCNGSRSSAIDRFAGRANEDGRAHTVPLTPQIAALLATRQRGAGPLYLAVPAAGFGGGRGRRRLDARAGIQTPWVIHDLRRTLSTGLSELEVAPHIIEALLNHATFGRALRPPTTAPVTSGKSTMLCWPGRRTSWRSPRGASPAIASCRCSEPKQ